MVVRRFLAVLIVPAKAPNADNGTTVRKSIARIPAGIAIPLCPIINATVRMNTSRITPDSIPDEIGAGLQSFDDIKPQTAEKKQKSNADRGTASLAGSAVGNTIAVIKRIVTKANARVIATDNAEPFNWLINPPSFPDSRWRAGKRLLFDILLAVVFIESSMIISFAFDLK